MRHTGAFFIHALIGNADRSVLGDCVATFLTDGRGPTRAHLW
jgi:hypothetical protein